MKIGIIDFDSTMIHLKGVGNTLSENNTEWRLVVWPPHTTDTGIYRIWEDNISIAALDEETQNGIQEHRIKIDWSKKYYDLNEIRIIDETRCFERLSKEEIAEKIGYVNEWVNDCEKVIINLTGLMETDPEKTWDCVRSLMEVLGMEQTVFYVFDHVPAFSFLLGYMKGREKWNEKLLKWEKICPIIYTKPDEILERTGNLGRCSIREYLKAIDKAYNESFFKMLDALV